LYSLRFVHDTMCALPYPSQYVVIFHPNTVKLSFNSD
jgi:hypothetical protein